MKNILHVLLKKIDFFSALSDGALEALANAAEALKLPAGTTIVAEGEEGNAFYVICEGEVEVTKKTAHGQRAKLSVSRSGEAFGEMSLLTSLPRSCTVTAKTDVRLGKISREDFEEIRRFDRTFTEMLERRARDYADFNTLKTLQPIALLEPEKMSILLSSMEEQSFTPGEAIIRQGEKGDTYFIIKSGRVAVIKRKEGREAVCVAEMQSGEGFGEEALIREEPRNATVQALEDTTVLTINKKAFIDILQNTFIENAFPEDLDAEEREKVIFIDARVTPEYTEEHIAGAMNVPVEMLRETYCRLDRTKEYYTYCTNDSRGMTAAFLMKSMGFHAKALRGGLSAWDGETVRTE